MTLSDIYKEVDNLKAMRNDDAIQIEHLERVNRNLTNQINANNCVVDHLKDYFFKILNDGSSHDFIQGYKAAIEDLENIIK